jgi:long-chain acyl-CoA synthetase
LSTLSARLSATAERYPERPAIVEGDRVRTYRGLSGAIQALARRLVDTGVEPGACVALVLPNGAGFVRSFFAVAHAGGIVFPLNPSLQEAEIAALLKDAHASLVLTVGEHRDRCARALRAAAGLEESAVIALDEPAEPPGPAAEEKVEPLGLSARATPEATVLYLYSSGSTGRPKRIERTHFHLLYETDRLIEALQISAMDRLLGVTPFSHTNGLMRSMVASMLAGAALVPLAQFERRAVGRTLEGHAITVFIGVPFMFAMLADTRWPRPLDLSSLRFCISSSAPLRPDTGVRFQDRYGIQVRQLYGTTETGTISVNLDPEATASIASVGMPLPGVSVEIFSSDRRVLEAGAVGEIGIKSPAAASEYPAAPEQTQAAFRNGYFFPGDIGYKDPGGRIYLVGRQSLFINRGGYKVNPYEIEEVIDRHPKVRESVVVGVDTEYGDQKIKAIVVPVEPCAEEEIIEFCRGQIASFKTPSIVEFRTALPKSATGKVQRKAL